MRFRLTASLAAGLSVLALAACSGAKDETTGPAAAASSEAPASEETGAPTEEVAATPAPVQSATPEPAPTPSATPTPEASPSAAPAKVAAAAPPPVAVAAPASFARCAVCHDAKKGGVDKLGPNLFGVYGHKMGEGSFAFSDAARNSGLTLDAATLDKWLENPRALVPGNRMSFPGLKDAAKRQEIIDYLKQLH